PPLSLSIIIRFEQFWALFHLIFQALPDSYTRLHPKTENEAHENISKEKHTRSGFVTAGEAKAKEVG
ncbi:unnamed protein product, partial [Brassica oleracea]